MKKLFEKTFTKNTDQVRDGFGLRMKNLLPFLFFVHCLLSMQLLHAQQRNWVGNVSSDWNTAGNWAEGAVPTANNPVTISNSNPCVISNGTSAVSRRIAIGSAGNLTVQSGASLTVSATSQYGISTDGSMTNNGDIEIINVTSTSLFNGIIVTNGTLTNGGDFTISQAGGGFSEAFRLQPSASAVNQSGSSLTTSSPVRCFINLGSFVNEDCAELTFAAGATAGTTATNFINNGYFYHFGNGSPNLTNNGFMQVRVAALGNNAQNNGLILSPISNTACTDEFENVTDEGGVNDYSIAATWYTDAALTTVAGTYSDTDDTFTAAASLPTGNQTLYFAVTDQANSCTETIAVTVNYTEPDCCPFSSQIYVDADATGAKDGTSWADAFTDLRDALNAVCGGATEIWVAAGTYYPDQVNGNNTNNRNNAFVMQNNLAIYGGFAGTETQLSQRNPAANETILSGDIDQDNSFSGNSYTVVLNNNNNLNNTAVLDGFTISGSNANGTSTITAQGGGMLNIGVSPRVVNCQFKGNSAFVRGGGTLNINGQPVFVNCVWTRNSAQSGGAISGFGNVNQTFVNCTIEGNSAGNGSGGIFNDQQSQTTLTNCILWNNKVGNSIGTPGANIANNSSNASFSATYSLLQGRNPAGTGNLDGTDAGNNPQFVQERDFGDNSVVSDLLLTNCSPALNAGNNAANSETTDVAGNARIFNSGTIDLGAYELQGAPDPTAPQIICPSNINANTNAGMCNAVVNYTAPVGTDNCLNPTTTQTAGLASGATFPEGTTTNTFEVSDGTQTANCSFTITVTDNEAPQITCPADINVNNDAGNCSAVVSFTPPVGTDNCTPTTTQTAGLASGADFPVGTTTNTFEVSDGTQTANCSFTITVTDNEAPQIACPADINVNNDAGNCSAVVTFTTPVGTDNCTPTTTQTAGLASGADFPVGTTVNTFVVSDGNQTANCSFSITATDNEAPNVVCQDIEVPLDADGNGNITADAINNGSNDACGIQPPTLSQTDFSTTDTGENTVTLTVTDNNGNTATCTATVTVSDNVPPMVLTTDIEVILSADGTAVITPDLVDNGTNDASGIADLTLDITGFDCADTGENTVILTATDNSGNTASATATVTVVDDSPAEIQCRQPVSTTAFPDECGVTDLTVLPPFVLSDNCGIGSGINISRIPAGNDFPLGTTTLIWTVTDSNGNAASCESLVIITDETAPTLTIFDTYIEYLEPGECLADVNLQAEVNDNCGTVTIEGNGNLNLPTGIHTHTISATDEAGNTVTREVTIYVHDIENPTVEECPEDLEIIANQEQNTLDLPQPTFTDNCEIISVTDDAPAVFEPGTRTVTFTAQDAYGNTSECSYDVTITPSLFFTGESNPIEVSAEANAGSSVNWNQPAARTLCEACTVTEIPEFIFLGEFEGHQYFLYPNAVDWAEAAVLSEEINGHLVTITDERENAFIQNNLPQSDEEIHLWTGLNYSDAGFAWLTGELLEYSNFIYDPVLSVDVINGTVLNADGSWTMMTADMQYGFLAERPCLDISQIAPVIETEGENGEITETLLTPGTDWEQGEYTVIYEARDMCDSTAVFSFGVTVQEPDAAYCQTSGINQEVWLERVVLNDYLIESENNAGYADFSEDAIELNGENPVNVQLIPGGIDLSENDTPQYWRIWADWNGDGDFFDADELLHEQMSENVVNVEFPALLNVEDLNVRLRIAVAQNQYPEACADYTTGEAEDYTLFFPAVEIDDDQRRGNENEIFVHPNPADNYVNVRFAEVKQAVISVSISGSSGNTYHYQPVSFAKKKELRIDLSDMTDGIYNLTAVTSEGDVITTRLVISRLYNAVLHK